MTTELRALVTLAIVGRLADAQTSDQRLHHLDRGYERMNATCLQAGVNTRRITQTGAPA